MLNALTLQPASDADLAALVAGQAPPPLLVPPGGIESADTLAMLRNLAAGIRPGFAPAAWLLVAAGEIVGLLSLVKPPAEGVLHIGYGIAPARRRLGHARAAVRALCNWARDDARVLGISAETNIDNLPSQKVLTANGFAVCGERHDDEDGAMLIWHRPAG